MGKKTGVLKKSYPRGVGGSTLAVGFHLVADLLALIVSPSVRMGQSSANGMLHVRLVGTPFEVAHMVVEFVAVNMIDARQAVRVRCECFDDQPMHLAAICFVVHPEGYGIVSFALNGLRHDAPNHSVVPLHRAHTSEVAHLILTVELLNRFPLFLFHCLVVVW